MASTLFSIVKTAAKLVLGRGVFRSYSQYGEDAILNAHFRNRTGFYIDVGAYHPTLYSNTYALYRRGWKGIVVEPNPAAAPLFRTFRPRDIFVNRGVGVGKKEYKTFKDGAYNTFMESKNGQEMLSLKELFEMHNVERVEFLNIDAEGLDLEVLQSHDWGVRPEVIAVEAEAKGPVREFLESKSYRLCGMTGKTLLFLRS